MFPDCYPELNEIQQLIRDTIRKVVEQELKPHVTAMESGDTLPYPHIKRFVAKLGMGGGGELTEAMSAAAPEDKLEHFLPPAVAIEVSRVDGGVLVSWGVSFGLLCNMRSFVFCDFLAGRKLPRSVAEVSAGKLFCCEAATQITHEAIHILGGNGYMEEYEVERLARDAKLMELGGGTTEIQELTIARNLVQMATA